VPLPAWNMPPSPHWCFQLLVGWQMIMRPTSFYKRLASMLALKWDHQYSTTLHWLYAAAFSLLRSSVQAIRGSRSSCGRPVRSPFSTEVNLRRGFLTTKQFCRPSLYGYTYSLVFCSSLLVKLHLTKKKTTKHWARARQQ
jgi:hypothetical protein